MLALSADIIVCSKLRLMQEKQILIAKSMTRKHPVSTCLLTVSGNFFLKISIQSYVFPVFLWFNYSDPEQLIFKPKKTTIFGEQYKTVLIPCKPTSPDVELNLIDKNETSMEISMYDPCEGFTVFFNESIHDKVMKCKARLPIIYEANNVSKNVLNFLISIGENIVLFIFYIS